MTAEQLKELRKSFGWTQRQLAEVLTDALGQPYRTDAVGKWEREDRAVPPAVASFLDAIGEGDAIPPRTSQDARRAPAGSPDDDTAPTGDGPPHIGPEALVFSGNYAHVCEQFFELVATGVGMIGAAVGNDALRADGRTILDDKAALGAAYGKLAETNETFRALLMQTDRQGAYLAVALATGTTAGRIWQNHQRRPEPVVSADEQLARDVADAAQ